MRGGWAGFCKAAFPEPIKGLGCKNILTKESIPFPRVLRNVSTIASPLIFICKGVLTERSFATKFKGPPTQIFVAHGLFPSPNNVVLRHCGAVSCGCNNTPKTWLRQFRSSHFYEVPHLPPVFFLDWLHIPQAARTGCAGTVP